MQLEIVWYKNQKEMEKTQNRDIAYRKTKNPLLGRYELET